MATRKEKKVRNAFSFLRSANKISPLLGAPAMMASIPESDQGQEMNKMSIRTATWAKLDSCDMVLFPRPCTYRIPRFKGENEAVERLAQLDIFEEAEIVKLNIDKAHERLRLQVIRSGKAFIVGTPGLRKAGFLLVRSPAEPKYKDVTRNGIHYLGAALEFSETKADLVVVGCVAVDKKGHMIGKGQGYSDLEYALLSKLGAIAPNAVVVTLVHDSQVYEAFPDQLFKIYDVPADIIVTPTRVIEVEIRLPKPALHWDILTSRRVNSIPILSCLFGQMQKFGVKLELMKGTDSDHESRRFSPPQSRRKRYMRRPRQASAAAQPQQGRRGGRREASAPRPNWRETFRRSPRGAIGPDGAKQLEGQQENLKPIKRGRSKITGRYEYTVDFSISVTGLTPTVRVRDLKAALIGRGVRPIDITWIAAKGVAVLHFGKRKSNQNAASIGLDEVVARLQSLSVQPEVGPSADLSVEVARPIIGTPTDNVETRPKGPKLFYRNKV